MVLLRSIGGQVVLTKSQGWNCGSSVQLEELVCYCCDFEVVNAVAKVVVRRELG
jgi:hypothetical protein